MVWCYWPSISLPVLWRRLVQFLEVLSSRAPVSDVESGSLDCNPRNECSKSQSPKNSCHYSHHEWSRWSKEYIYIYTHTHTHIYIYIYICVCRCVCVCFRSWRHVFLVFFLWSSSITLRCVQSLICSWTKTFS